MKILESLKTLQAKKEYRELVQKYHSDIGGNHEIMVDINSAKDAGDEELHKIYQRLIVQKRQQSIKPDNKKQIQEWLDGILTHYPGMFASIIPDFDNKYYIEIIYKSGNEVVKKYVSNIQNCKSQSELAKKIKEILLK